MIDEIDFTKYKRFFAFGCSFTKYHYGTWADIVGIHIPEYYNYGLSGAGNQYMFHSLIEAITEHNINKDDLVIIMWTNVAREDRKINDSWVLVGNIFTQQFYDFAYIKKYVDLNFYLMRDLSFIKATQIILDSIGCDYDFLSMVPIRDLDQYHPSTIDTNNLEKKSEILNFYKDIIELIKPSVRELLYPDGIWNRYTQLKVYDSQTKRHYYDRHPTTDTYYKYLQLVYKNFQINKDAQGFIDEQMEKIKNTVYNKDTKEQWVKRKIIKRL